MTAVELLISRFWLNMWRWRISSLKNFSVFNGHRGEIWNDTFNGPMQWEHVGALTPETWYYRSFVYWLSIIWTSQECFQVFRKPEGQIFHSAASWHPEYKSVASTQLVRYSPLGLAILGIDAKQQSALRVALAAHGERPVVVTSAKAFLPNQPCGGTLAVFLVTWPPLTIYFPSSDSLTFLLLPRVPFWFSNNFSFCQVSHIGFYCLHPVTRVLVYCFCPWPWSPSMANSLSTVSKGAFQSYFCIILKISSKTWSAFFIILQYP